MARKATKTPEELAAAHTKYKNTWQRENKDRIPITVPIGDKDRIAAWAKSKGYQSTNSYITDLIYKDMGGKITPAAMRGTNEAEDGPKPVKIQRGAHNEQIKPGLSDS